MWGFLAGILVSVAPTVIFRILTVLGIGVAVFTGYQVVVTELNTLIMANYSQIPSSVLTIFHMSGVTTGLGIIISAMVASVTLKTVIGGVSKFKIN